MTIEPLRASYRRHVRDTALDVTRALVLERGWDGVRLADVATRTGVSRPTLYKEFGDRQGLGEALLLQEQERFLVGVRGVVEAHAGDPGVGVLEAVRFTLAEAQRSPLLHAVLTSSRRADDGLVPLLATSAPLLRRAVAVLVEALGPHLPGTPEQELAEVADTLVRLVVSHLVQPGPDPEQTAQRLARVARRCLALPS